jgi:hypothetical protein
LSPSLVLEAFIQVFSFSFFFWRSVHQPLASLASGKRYDEEVERV